MKSVIETELESGLKIVLCAHENTWFIMVPGRLYAFEGSVVRCDGMTDDRTVGFTFIRGSMPFLGRRGDFEKFELLDEV